MAYTLSTPQTVTKAAVLITAAQVSFADSQSAATLSYVFVDQAGNQIPGTAAWLTIPPADFVQIWNAGVTLAALYTYLAGKLGLPSGTSTGDGTLK